MGVQNKEINTERVISAFFVGFCLIGLASLLFIFDVISGKDRETTLSFNVHQHKVTKLEKVFNAKDYRLDNGLQIVVIENNRAPVVTHMIWYRVGAADEPIGKSGIAHFLEHLMFKGHSHPELGTMEPGEFSKLVRSLGGEDNAFTSQDYTAYFQSIAKEHLETVMTAEAARMRGLTPPIEEVISENKVILEERLQRTDTNPKAQIAEQMDEVLFPNHPYSIPIIGWMHEMEQLTWDDAKSFYDLHYAPNNAVLVVSGDVTGEEVLEIAKRTYGVLKPAETPERLRTSSPPFIGEAQIKLRHDTIREPIIKREYRVPSYRNNSEEALALQVFEEIMSGGATSRLYKSLVVEQQIVTNIALSYNPASWDDSTLSIGANVTNEDKISAVHDAINTELRKVILDGVTKAEIKEAKERMKNAAIYATDRLSGPAMIIGYNMMTGSTLDDIEYWPANIDKVSANQVQNVAHKYLNPDQPYKIPPVTGLLLPEKTKSEDAE